MRILFLGVKSGTTLHRIHALQRLGHNVEVIIPDTFIPRGRLSSKLHWESGGVFVADEIARQVVAKIGDKEYDLVWVDGGRYVSAGLVSALRKRSKGILNFNNDDPFGWRDRCSWLTYRKAVSEYDLIVVRRHPNVGEAVSLGARSVMFTYLTADEIAHAPRELSSEDHGTWDSDVLFVGTWMPERGPFMLKLIEAGIPLTIYGGRWQRSKEWKAIRPYWRGAALNDGDNYAKAIQCSKIALGLLSKGNRDLHTRRSIEIPYLGGLLCAERTSEHLELYNEGSQAVFWSSARECANLCASLLSDEESRVKIAQYGRIRCIENGHFNEPFITRVIERGLQARQ